MSQNPRKIDTGTEELLFEVDQGVGTITLNRPHARNSLSDDLTPALRRSIAQCGEDPAVRAVLITGAGDAFCSGGDVKGMGGSSGAPPASTEERTQRLRVGQRTLTGALVGLRKPTLAALPGPAAGAGLAIALACDLRIASQSAILTTGYARIALPGDYGITWLLTRLVGTARARELMFLSERVDADRAERLGLLNWIVPHGELRVAAFALARRLADGPSSALALMKENLDQALDSDLLTAMDQEAHRMVRAASGADHREAVAAFAAKRPPVFGSRD